MIAVEALAEPAARPSTSGSGLWLELPKGRRIGVGSGFDAATLVRLLTVLDRV